MALFSMNTLEHSRSEHQASAESKRKLADSLMVSAENHEKAGDTVNAERDRASAERYQQEADDLEKTAYNLENEIRQKRSEAQRIEQKIDEAKKRHQKEVADLEKEKGSLLG